MRKRKARFNSTDHDDVIERQSQNLGVDVHQSYQHKHILRELQVKVVLRLKRNRADAQN